MNIQRGNVIFRILRFGSRRPTKHLCREWKNGTLVKFDLNCPRNISTVCARWRVSVSESAWVTQFGLRPKRRHFSVLGSAQLSDWNIAVSNAEKIVGYPTSFMSLRCLLSDEISNVALNMRKLVGTKHPLLKTARGLLYDGKHSLQMRGLIVLLLSKAAGFSPQLEGEILERDQLTGICSKQRTLAEITEMIHTANIIHKGVVNLSDVNPAVDGPIKDLEFGNKMAVLSGDFLLANATTGLAELNNTKVVEMMARAIGHLMEAEFTGLQDKHGVPMIDSSTNFSHWLKQTFLSSGSLLANGCLAAMELVKQEESVQQLAFEFGTNMAYARQLSEDMLPFMNPTEYLDQLTPICAPVVKYAERHGVTSLDILNPAHVNSTNRQKILSMIKSDSVLEECHSLCEEYGQKAIGALNVFPSSDAKTALVQIVEAVMK